MAGSGLYTLKAGLKKGCAEGASAVNEFVPARVEVGNGTPTHAAPEGTVYIKQDATAGTASHYRRVYLGTTTVWAWKAMSDD